MKNLCMIAVTAIAFTAFPLLPAAAARETYILDQASLFSPATLQSLNQEISAFNAKTGKEIVVDTVPSLNGKTIQQAAEDEFARQQVNGVLIFLAKDERKDIIVPDRAAAAFFPAGSFQSIRQAMRGYFRTGDFNTGLQTGVSLLLDQYRSHERALGTRRMNAPITTSQSFGGLSLFWFILVLIAGFFIVRALFRAMSGPRMMPPGYGGPGYGSGPGPGFGGGGYGPGYGGGGGGGFMSGLLGGLGGAFLGNELFGNHGNNAGNLIEGNQAAGFDGNQQIGDTSGWQSDAGQADMGNAASGSFGDAGGGFDSGGFDGGGGGFDNSGGGDGGGGW